MKSSHKTRFNKGSAILEVLIAIAILTLGISAAAMLVFGNQSLQVDNDTNSEALYKAKGLLEQARASSTISTIDFNSLVTMATTTDDNFYFKKLIVDPFAATECNKQIESKVTWITEVSRPQEISLVTRVTSLEIAESLGGDCPTVPPAGGDLMATGTPVNIGPSSKTNALDVLNKKAYIALQDDLGFMIVDTTDLDNPICYGMGGGGCSSFIPYANGYSSGDWVYDIDVARASDDRIYAYLARATTSPQFEIVDVTDPANPDLIAKKQLNGITVGAQYSEGYKVFYYKNKIYLTTRETAGKELHVFNVKTPWDVGSITEFINPTELNRTVNDLKVLEQEVSETVYTLAYLVADSNLKEVAVFDVTDPSSPQEISASVLNLLGDYNATSLFFSPVNKLLYVGREKSNSYEQLYVFDATNPFIGLTEINKIKIGANPNNPITPLAIRVAGPNVFMVSGNAGNEDLHIHNSNPTDLSFFQRFDGGNKGVDIDYEDNFLYEIMLEGDTTLLIYHVP